MTIALFGATGMTGGHVLKQLLDGGHHVRALVRNPEKITTEHPALSLIKGDVFNTEQVMETCKEVDGVISCLGIGGMGDGSKTTLVSQGTRSILSCMPRVAFACISNTGVGNSKRAFPRKMRNSIRFSKNWKWFRAVLADKTRMEKIIKSSGHLYTIVRSPQIENSSKRSVVLISDNGVGIGTKVTAADLAAFLISSVTFPKNTSRTLSISSDFEQ
ncbi:MAG: hypothetical protein RL754_391 [Bacteroidota bacterium]|jgi:uncharacterized protein YbjT (DUF2867 family)